MPRPAAIMSIDSYQFFASISLSGLFSACSGRTPRFITMRITPSELYSRQSPHSVIWMRSMRLHQPLKVSGKRSAMPPGLQPEARKLTPPFLAAASIIEAASGCWMKG